MLRSNRRNTESRKIAKLASAFVVGASFSLSLSLSLGHTRARAFTHTHVAPTRARSLVAPFCRGACALDYTFRSSRGTHLLSRSSRKRAVALAASYSRGLADPDEPTSGPRGGEGEREKSPEVPPTARSPRLFGGRMPLFSRRPRTLFRGKEKTRQRREIENGYAEMREKERGQRERERDKDGENEAWSRPLGLSLQRRTPFFSLCGDMLFKRELD